MGCNAAIAQASTNLLLEVTVNGTPKHLVGNFVRSGDGRIGAAAKELEDIGVEPPGNPNAQSVVFLDAIPGVTFAYDDEKQTIAIKAPESQLAAQKIDAMAPRDAADDVKVQRDFGALLNYSIFGSGGHEFDAGKFNYNGASASLDSRMFTSVGTFSQTGILGNTTTSSAAGERLDTSWTYSTPATEMTYRAGDTISGGLAWTRPVRLGGLQVQRNFGLRPDLVTLPLPSVSGSAAVPSSVDVYVNSVKTFTQAVDTGPFLINNLPAVSGAGTATVVVRDASGREIESSLPFFVSAKLLKPGLFDFSAEAGLPRLNYGSKSFDYSKTPVGSASGRYGLTDWLTLEGHAEAAPRFGNGGVGFDIRTADLGVLTLAAAGSRFGSLNGGQLFAGYDMQLWGFTVSAASQRTFGGYRDIAAITAPNYLASASLNAISQATGLADYFDFGSSLPDKKIDRISIGIPLVFDRSSINVSYASIAQADGQKSRIASTSYSHRAPFGATIFTTAFIDLADKKNMGLFAGISIPFGGDMFASTGVSRNSNGLNVVTQASKSVGQEPGSYGWNVTDLEGQTATRSAAASYRSSVAQVQAGVVQSGSSVQGSAQIDGAFAFGAGNVFMSPRIDDAFAIVDAGAPNVGVEVENRPAGTTGSSGKMLVPNLHSFQKNKIVLDPTNLPLTATMDTTKEVVAPADGGLVVVDFGVRTDVKAALVTLVKPDGKPLAVGSKGLLNGKSFIVGYDGIAYIDGLGDSNVVTVASEAANCSASFDYKMNGDKQVKIGPVTCQ